MLNDEFNGKSGPGEDVPGNGEAHNLGIHAWENEGGAVDRFRLKKGTHISHAFKTDDLNADSEGQ